MGIELLVFGSLAVISVSLFLLFAFLAGYRFKSWKVIVVKPTFLNFFYSKLLFDTRTPAEREDRLRRGYLAIAASCIVIGGLIYIQIYLGL